MYPNLFSPIEVGGFKLKNRIIRAPLYVGQANEDGTVSQATLEHYAARAVSGAALVVVEASSVSPNSDGATAYGIKAHDDQYLPGLTKLASAIKENGAISALQIFHAGRRTTSRCGASASCGQSWPSITGSGAVSRVARTMF